MIVQKSTNFISLHLSPAVLVNHFYLSYLFNYFTKIYLLSPYSHILTFVSKTFYATCSKLYIFFKYSMLNKSPEVETL